jgi:hypothetical protein
MGGVPLQWPSGNSRYQRDTWPSGVAKTASNLRKIDALDDTLSTGSRFSLRFFATWTAMKNAAKSLT